MTAEKQPIDDWDAYRTLSLAPGGFGHSRAEIWPKLLHARPTTSKPETNPDESASHPDERQIRLDTDRSFVLYPVDSSEDKEKLQSDLHELLVEIFRRRPGLSYFQGFHDIMTVLLLTLPPELQLSCAEQLSLQRNLLRVADPEYAQLLEQTAPLPYYALPNLLTLFSHDMPALPLIQHTFDYLLCRPPICVVYLATAIILSRKADVQRLEEEDEEGLIHSLLSALPDLVDAEADIKEEEDQLPFKAEVDEVPLKEEASVEEETPVKEEQDLQPHLDRVDATNERVEEPTTPLGALSDDASSIPADSKPDTCDPEPKLEPDDSETKIEPRAINHDPPVPIRRKPRPKPQLLTNLLAASDALYSAHPPSDHSLHLSSVMGPQSVVYTWSPRSKDMPSADEAERMVQRLDLIVYPELPPEPEKKGKERRPMRKRGSGSTGVILGATLVLGVAIAVSVYGTRQSGGELRRAGQWVGGLFGVV
ncbi:TBC1 domain member 20 [Mycena kentingensis (nom. inval.)]|nr:TBC1 domain member 20 [Mycena kentingensis (nom. inval.)]